MRVKWIGVLRLLWNDGPPRADNILCPSLRWGVGGTYEIWALESQPYGHYGGVDVRVVEPSLPVWITSLGVWKIRAPLRAASVTISFRSTI